MSLFDSFAVVDWSSGNDTGPRPRKDAIWAGAVLGSDEIEPHYLRNRDLACDWIADLISRETAAGRRLMIGFDFPFGYPRGFAQAITGQPDTFALWDHISARLDDTPRANNRFAVAGALNAAFPGIGPFWFNATKHEIPNLPRRKHDRTFFDLPERREAERRAKGSFTCWQMGGAGAVGGQVMTGIAALRSLRQRFSDQISIWPFEPLDRPVAFVEIWPSLIRGPVAEARDPIKDRAQVRLLARALATLDPKDLERMLQVDAPEEGWILGLGQEARLAEAACRI